MTWTYKNKIGDIVVSSFTLPNLCEPDWECDGGQPKFMTEYQPETIAIPISELENIIDALEAGLEHTQTVLSEHDASLGRTTRKNKRWAESLEKDIEFLSNQMKFLKLKLIVATTHYP